MTQKRKQLRYGLTLHTPWDQAILYGSKRIENRSWAPKSLECPEWIALHAGLTHDEMAAYSLEKEGLHTFDEDKHKPGHIVGLIRIAGFSQYDDPAHDHADDPWAFGPVCWHIDRVLSFDSPIKCSGARSLWPIPYGKIDTLRQTANSHMNRLLLLQGLDSKTCSCGEHIYMVRTPKGSMMPLHEQAAGSWDVVEGHAVHVGKLEGKFEPHWATCPHAQRHRRAR